MSQFLTGDIILAGTQPVDATVSLVTRIYEKNKSRIHIKFGGNVSNQYFRTASERNAISYEITDSILENTAEGLLAGKYVENVPEWSARLRILNAFVCSIFEEPSAARLIMNINITGQQDISDAICLTCKCADFEKNFDWAYAMDELHIDPIIHLEITR